MGTMSGHRVLVVDDRPNIQLMQAILSPAGYEVLVATNGESALGWLKARRRT